MFTKPDLKKFTPDYFYRQMDSNIEISFNHEQRKEIKSLLKRVVQNPAKKIVDVRFTFWFFQRLYIVLFLGKDIRRNKRPLDTVRINSFLSLILKIGIYAIITLILLILLFFALYFIKSILGINFFPNKHLWDFLI
jgi:hypothetical protein